MPIYIKTSIQIKRNIWGSTSYCAVDIDSASAGKKSASQLTRVLYINVYISECSGILSRWCNVIATNGPNHM